MAASDLRTAPGAIDPGVLRHQLDELRGTVGRVYLHVDLDALDAGVARANRYAAPGGPILERLLAALEAVFDRFTVAAAAITAYDPTTDHVDGSSAAAARAVAQTIARRAVGQRRR